MRWLAAASFFVFIVQATAGNVTCSSEGASVIKNHSCTTGSVASLLFENPPAVTGNSFAIARAGQTNFDPISPVAGGTSSGSASFDDLFRIPTSPGKDVLKIAILIETDSQANFSSDRLFAEVRIGPGTTGSPVLDYMSLDRPGNCQRLPCSFQVVAPASGLTMVELAGSASLRKDTDATAGFAFSFTSINISRFAPDRVTPDPFAPEPGTAELAGATLAASLAAACLKRRPKTMAYS
jgi:hypothetical protein